MTVTPLRNSTPGERVPPNHVGLEQSLLGALLMSKDAIGVAVEHLTADDFYRPAHGHIYEAVVKLYNAGDTVDFATVEAELTRNGLLDSIGGPKTLLGLFEYVGATTPATIAGYARRIADTAVLRRLNGVGGEIAELGYDHTDPAEALDNAEGLLFKLSQNRRTDSARNLSDLLIDNLDELERRYEQGASITGTPTGFTDLDELTSGLQPNALYIIGARPSMGKTALVLNMALHAAMDAQRPVLIFSLEMGANELTQRMICAEARVDSKRMRNGDLTGSDWEKIAHATGRLADAAVTIDDNPSVTLMEIRSKARRMKSHMGDLGMIVVDYLQLMTGSGESRQMEITHISRGLKILARELECPVVALSQLSRQLEMRADKRPMLADLRESGSLEQDADVVMFLYRDEKYREDSPDRGTAEIIVAKHRNGPTGTVKLAFLDQYTKFANLARSAA